MAPSPPEGEGWPAPLVAAPLSGGEGDLQVKRYSYCNITILALTLVCISMGCATGISREALLEKMTAEPAPFIVDVRSQGEFDKDHIPGALHIPFYSISSGLNEIGFSKKDLLILYCEHGPRSGIASLMLFLSGYEEVYSLDGHMQGWRNNAFPIEVITH